VSREIESGLSPFSRSEEQSLSEFEIESRMRLTTSGKALYSDVKKMDKPVYRNTVGPQYEGWSVLRFYSERYRHSSFSQWEKWIRGGRVQRNGKKAVADEILSTGDILLFFREERDEPEVNRSYRVVHEDGHVIVVNKPVNLPVMPSGVFFRNTLLHFLRSERLLETIHPAHRLDIETSGLVVFTKTRKAASLISRAFREREVVKEYEAILCGLLEEEIRVNAPVGRIHHTVHRFCYGITDSGRDALTVFTPIKYFSSKDLTLVKVSPHTGRIHQIRIHSAFVDHPILGDRLYGGDPNTGPGDSMITVPQRLALHATFISFPHPDGKKKFDSMSPDWFRDP
jgi:23S rRNA pseudouridine1911/1915/1917 synthase